VSEIVLAVDVGGTKLAVGRVDGGGEVLERATVPTAGPGTLWERLAGLVDQVRQGDEVVCGVGCGGPMRPGGETVSPLNIDEWRGFPLRARLGEHLGIPVAIDNDAKALALGEGWRGAAAGVDHFVAMVVSTGVGGGIVLDGRLLEGAGSNAGHIGHVIVEPDGRMCGCGARGCLEAEASGTAIAAITGRPAAEADHEMRRRCGTLVGRGLASVVNLLDLHLAVVAGSVALGYGDVFFAAANEELTARSRIEFAHGARIIPAGLGPLGPLVGAAAVGFRARAGGRLPGR
jgi:glucokinase